MAPPAVESHVCLLCEFDWPVTPGKDAPRLCPACQRAGWERGPAPKPRKRSYYDFDAGVKRSGFTYAFSRSERLAASVPLPSHARASALISHVEKGKPVRLIAGGGTSIAPFHDPEGADRFEFEVDLENRPLAAFAAAQYLLASRVIEEAKAKREQARQRQAEERERAIDAHPLGAAIHALRGRHATDNLRMPLCKEPDLGKVRDEGWLYAVDLDSAVVEAAAELGAFCRSCAKQVAGYQAAAARARKEAEARAQEAEANDPARLRREADKALIRKWAEEDARRPQPKARTAKGRGW